MALLKVLVFLERELGIWVPDEELTDEVDPRRRATLAAYVCASRAGGERRRAASVALLGPDVILLADGDPRRRVARRAATRALVVELATRRSTPHASRRALGRFLADLPVARRPAADVPRPWSKLALARPRRAVRRRRRSTGGDARAAAGSRP